MRRYRQAGLMPLWAPLALLVAALGLGGWAYTIHSQAQAFLRNAARAEGKVIGFTEGGERVAPVVEFKAADGRVRQITGRAIDALHGTGEGAGLEAGQRVTVAYRPEDPDDARVLGVQGPDWTTALLGGLGALCGLIGGVLLLASIRNRSAARLAAGLR